jgi:hypothetical protein
MSRYEFYSETSRFWDDPDMGAADAFYRPLTGYTNQIDLPPTYPFSEERYRLEINGTRTHIDETAKATDRNYDFVLEPAAGDRITIRTAERLRYIVGFDAVASWAWQQLTTLDVDDVVRVGVSDLARNGYYVEYTGEDSAAGYTAEAIIENATDGIVARESFGSPVDPTATQRDAVWWNWYNAGRARFVKTYTDDGEQFNDVVARLSRDGEPATEASNLFLFLELDAATAGQQLSVGSMGYATLADVSPTVRRKVVRYTGLDYSGSGGYEPAMALRLDQTKDNVFATATNLTVSGFSSTGGEAILVGVDPSLTDASGFGTPDQVTTDSSIIEGTTNVTTFPDSTRTAVTSATSFAGYQILHTSLNAAGDDLSEGQVATSAKERAPIHSDDVAVLLVRPDDGSAQSGLTAVAEIAEEW